MESRQHPGPLNDRGGGRTHLCSVDSPLYDCWSLADLPEAGTHGLETREFF